MAVDINGREYEWGDLTLILGGRDLTRFRGIKYTGKIEREPLFAKGRTAVSIQTGNEAVEGEIKMLQSEYEALVDAGKGTVLSLNLDALVSYGDPFKGDNMTTDRIEGIRFTEATKEFNQGDKFQEITLPFLALKIVNQV